MTVTGSVIGGWTVYSTRISVAAALAISLVSATTMASTSPRYDVRPPTGIITGQSVWMMPTRSSPGMSAAVYTAWTPATASAAVASMATMSARACSLKCSAACRHPSGFMSSMYGRMPIASWQLSYFTPRDPTPPGVTITGMLPLASASTASRIFV